MKLIIAGSRTMDVHADLIDLIMTQLRVVKDPSTNPLEEVVSGTAQGADKSGEKYAFKYGIPVRRFPADWNTHGKAAGPIRNKQMAEYADELLLIWDGESRGSANMKRTMESMGKRVHEVILRGSNV